MARMRFAATPEAARGKDAAMSKLLVISGSTRPPRAADLVTPWLTGKVSGHADFDAEIADLRDWPLPIFAEHFGTIGDVSDPTYSEPLVKAWNAKIKSADAYVIVTPEYNHSVPGGLKNAIDSVWVSFGFRNKPVAFVSYAGGQAGGVRAIEHLAHIFVEAEAAPMRNSVIIQFVRDAFDSGGQPRNPVMNAAADIMLDDLAWWSAALEKARAAGELPPGNARLAAAMAAGRWGLAASHLRLRPGLPGSSRGRAPASSGRPRAPRRRSGGRRRRGRARAR